MRNLARAALRMAGFERARSPTFADLLRHKGIDTVFDVGANRGQYATELREHGYRGKILSFEPIAGVYLELERVTSRDALWEAHNLALGNVDEERPLVVAEQTVFSSFKPRTEYVAQLFQGSKPITTQQVKVARLDTFLSMRPLNSAYLKVDTQGFEREVLLGTGDRLGDFKAIQLELPMRSLYQGQPEWLEMARWMADRGFVVTMAKENGYDLNEMRLLELDVVFVRERE